MHYAKNIIRDKICEHDNRSKWSLTFTPTDSKETAVMNQINKEHPKRKNKKSNRKTQKTRPPNVLYVKLYKYL